MGDHRAGSGGTRVAPPTGKRVARHAAEQVLPTPYAGRRVAAAVSVPGAPPVEAPPVEIAPADVAPALVAPVEVAPVEIAPVEIAPVEIAPVEVKQPTLTIEPVLAAPQRTAKPAGKRVAPKPPTPHRPPGKRVSTRRSPIPLPSAPLLVGIAMLGVSAGGALQAVHPGLTSASSSHHLVPASALSGTSAIGSASLLGGRSAVVSRDSNRQTLSRASGSQLQAQADAQVEQRNVALSQFAAKAERQAHKIALRQWVLPVATGVYHLTARFGDYSPLWSHFHTGLDFAAPTGTSIMAVAGGVISEVGYSGAYGNRTVETLPDGTELWYCHQNAFGTSVGATVRPGQVIGYVGSTGNVTGPHLHLEVHPGGGDPVDPFTALEVHGLNP